MFFDTHAHYDDEAFEPGREELLGILRREGVELVVNPGCDEQSSLYALGLSARHEHVYAAVGWHPQAAAEFDRFSPDKLRLWCKNAKVVAIGEIGLDYYYDDGAPREVQRRVFEEQLRLAEELDMPVIVHDRDAHADCMELVRAHKAVRGVFHCYSGSAQMAEELVKLGWYLSFTGAITFKNARRAPEAIAACPMDRIMIETDSPYMSPEPYRGRRNDSRMLPYIAKVIGDIKGLSTEDVARITTENGKRFFGIA